MQHPNTGNSDRAPALVPRVVSRKNFLKLSGAGLAGAFLLGTVGCGGEEQGGNQQLVLRAAYNRAIDNLDPHGSRSAEQGTILAANQIYDTVLVRQEEETAPNLATEWNQPDPKTWVFTLREDVTFHDGSQMTANDVKASLERLANSGGPLSPLWEQLDTVEATDDQTLTITTTQPLGTMLANLTQLYVLPASNLAEAEETDFFRNPLGSGPFKVESFRPSQELVTSAFTDYWDGAPEIDRLELPYIPEDSARLTAVNTGEVDVTWTIPPDQISQLESNSSVELVRAPSFYYWFNWFNCGREPFTNPDVRRAMWHALDVETIINELYGDTVELARAPIPSSVFGYAPQEPYEYDPERARQMLADAGHPDGFSTSVMWSSGSAPIIRQFAETLISYWAEVGVEVEPQELEQAQWLDKLLALDWDMDLQTNDVSTGDADITLGRLYTCEANRMGYCNRELDEILIAARTTTDQEERAELYAQACEIIWNDAVGVFPADRILTYATRSNVQDFQPSPIETPKFETVSIRQQN